MVSAVKPIHRNNVSKRGRQRISPMPRQNPVDREEAALDTGGANADAGKEIDRIEQRPAELDRRTGPELDQAHGVKASAKGT